MKKQAQLFTYLFAFILIGGFSACNNAPCDCDKQNKGDINSDEVLSSPYRGESNNAQVALFADMQERVKDLLPVEVLSNDAMTMPDDMAANTIEASSEGLDESTVVMGIFSSLLNTESTGNMLDIQFSMSEKPVEDGLFVFALKAPEDGGTQSLDFQMYNEKSFAMVANNSLEVTPGNNYKVLNVKDIEDGIYIFKLSSSDNRELLRRITIGEQLTQ